MALMRNQRPAARRRVHRHGEERSQMSRCQPAKRGLAGTHGALSAPAPGAGGRLPPCAPRPRPAAETRGTAGRDLDAPAAQRAAAQRLRPPFACPPATADQAVRTSADVVCVGASPLQQRAALRRCWAASGLRTLTSEPSRCAGTASTPRPMSRSAIPEEQAGQRQRRHAKPEQRHQHPVGRAERPRHVQRAQPLFEPVASRIARKAAHGATRGVDEHGRSRRPGTSRLE
jgi:hypothetical protein